jgi:fused signal recognition particle receptor
MVFNWFRRKFSDDNPASDPAEHPAELPVAEEETLDSEPLAQPSEPDNSKPTSAEPVVAPPYLAWAKAAFQNIQTRRNANLGDLPTTEITAEVEPENVEVARSESELAVSPVTPDPLPEISTLSGAAAPETSPEFEPEVIASPSLPVGENLAGEPLLPESIVSIDIAGEVSPGQPPSTSETPATPELPQSLTFWQRAEADRQERQQSFAAIAEIPEVQTPVVKIETAAEFPPPLLSPEPLEKIAEEPSELDLAGESAASDLGSDLVFDEGFIWSAEVLAAQGRQPEDVSLEEITWLQKLRLGLGKTRRGLVNQLKAVVGKGPLSQEAGLEIESLLLQADVGVEATEMIIQALQTKLRQETLPPDAAIAYLKQILRDILDRPFQQGYSPQFGPEKDRLNIWLLTGVNGVGKTTTLGKIAHIATASGYRCLIGAADTFRAAAVEQVKIWGDRSQVEVIANPGKNTDPAAVVFDAITAAQSRGSELLLVDTAGRLQNKQNLMEELRKIRRIIDKKAPGAKVESLLVLDATLGQNGLRQAQVFAEAAQVSGVVMTKLDGTAKGGVALAVVQQLGLPIRFVGAGEGIGDLRPFSSYEFVEALLSG